jgi:hypothetical protein
VNYFPVNRFGGWILGVALLAGVAALPWLLGRTEPVTREGLEAARRKWHQAGIASYNIEFVVSGTESGRYYVEVREGQLTHISRNGQAASPNEPDYWTVNGLFRTIELELDHAEDPAHGAFPEGSELWLRMRCDPEFGFPVRYIRQVTGTTTTGVEIRVRRFEPLRVGRG